MDWLPDVLAAQAGEPAAFEQVVRRFQSMAVAYAYSILGDFQLAEDVSQEAFVQAYLNLSRLRDAAAFPAWLRRIVFCQCSHLTRGKRVTIVPLQAAAEVPDSALGPPDRALGRETSAEVLASVAALPEGEKVAVLLFYVGEYSLQEVGRFLEVPPSTVKSRLHSARSRLRARMMRMVEQTLPERAPGDEFTRSVRKVLGGVPKVGFGVGGDGSGNFFFPASLRAALAYLGEDPAYDYTFLVGVSGAAFGLLWDTRGWLYASDITDLEATWPDPIARTFQALGYGHQIVRRRADGDEDLFRQRIVESIDGRGMPVLAFGVVGPPCCNLVSGYDEKGAVLTGWSFFQSMAGHGEAIDFEPTGYFRKRDWFADTPALILIGERGAKAPLGESYLRALEWAVEVARTPLVCERHQGLAAYEPWASALLRDEDFPAGELSTLLDRLDCHFGALFVAGEGRHYAARFLRRVAEQQPPLAADLERAASLYESEAGLIHRIYQTHGGFDPHDESVARRLAEPDIRREIAALIREAGRMDAEAIGLIERALWPPRSPRVALLQPHSQCRGQ